MTIETFAAEHRLKVTRDDCNDQIIAGRKGHLWLDRKSLCCTLLDTRPIKPLVLGRLQARRCWRGTISKVGGKRVQDIELREIQLDNWRLAVKLAGIRQRRVLSEAEAEVLRTRLKLARAAGKRLSLG